MRRYAWILSFLVGVAAGAVANRCLMRLWRPSPPEPADIVTRLARNLSLDDAQRAQALKIVAAARPRVERLFAQMRATMGQVREETDSQLAAILRPDQKEKFAALQAKWKQREGKGWGPGSLPPP